MNCNKLSMNSVRAMTAMVMSYHGLIATLRFIRAVIKRGRKRKNKTRRMGIEYMDLLLDVLMFSGEVIVWNQTVILMILNL